MDSLNVVLTGRQQVELQREPVPELPDDGILVRTRLSLMSSGTELFCYRGEMGVGSHWAGWVRYPFYLGYSNVGQIEQVGPGVEGYHPGDRVFCTANHKQFHLQKSPVVKIPDEISDESAAWSKLATIAQTGVRRAQIEMGARVAIVGQGPIGQLLTQYARVLGAAEVMAIDPVRSRLEISKAHGATQTFAGSVADAVPFVEAHTHGKLADVVFDATGHYAVFPLALKLVRRFGMFMLIGDSPNPEKQTLTSDVLTRQITIRGTHNERLPADEGEWSPERQTQLFHTYLARGQMRVDDLITARYSPEEAPQVYSQLLADRSGTIGVAFDWGKV